MHGRIILRNAQVKIGGGKTANGGHDLGGHDPVTLRGDETDPGVQQNLLLKQNIKRCALANSCVRQGFWVIASARIEK